MEDRLVEIILIPVLSSILAGLLMYNFGLKSQTKEEESPKNFSVLKFLNTTNSNKSIVVGWLFAVLINMVVGLISCYFIENSIENGNCEYILSILSSLIWSTVSYINGGALGLLFLLLFRENQILLNGKVFSTIGFIGAGIVLPICSFFIFFVGDNLWAYHSVVDLYNLEFLAILRLYVPSAVSSIGFGLYFGYLFHNTHESTFVNSFLSSRVKIIAVSLLVILVFYYLVQTLNTKNFLWRALEYNEIAHIWMGYVEVVIVTFIAGTYIFDWTIKKLLTNDKNDSVA